MTRFLNVRGVPRPPGWGLVKLKDHFEQRKIGAVYGSMRSRVPLRTPSGAQNVESALECDLLEQLNFSFRVYDLLTQPIIRYESDGKKRQYTPDILVQLYSEPSGPPVRYFIEVKRSRNLMAQPDTYRGKFIVACEFAEANAGRFRVMTEQEIQIPFLRNVRLLTPRMNHDSDDGFVDLLRTATADAPVTVHAMIELLRTQGVAEPEARREIERAVANGRARCDLAQPFTDASTLDATATHVASSAESSPILAKLEASTWH